MTADEQTEHSTTFRVPASHAALAGHFPGHPVVPGVVVLDAVISAAEDWLGVPLTALGLRQAKFVAPMLPEETARIDLTLRGLALEFTVRRDGTAIAKGTFDIAREPVP